MDIHFVNADGQEVKVSAELLVTLPIPEGWDTDTVGVYYVNPDADEVVDMNGVVSEDGTTVSFTTNHFSYYAVVKKADAEGIDPPEKEPETPPTEDPTPQPPTNNDTSNLDTGDDSNAALWLALLLTAGPDWPGRGFTERMPAAEKAHIRDKTRTCSAENGCFA